MADTTIHERFPGGIKSEWYIVDDNGCWIWQRALNAYGYGVTRTHSAHRAAYELAKGPIPNGLDLDHLCRVRACVNPDHLEAVTRAENLRRGAGTRLTPEMVQEIRDRVARAQAEKGTAPYGFMKALREEYGVSRSHLGNIIAGRRWVDAA